MGRWYDIDTETELTTRVALTTEEIRGKVSKVMKTALQRFGIKEPGAQLSFKVAEVKKTRPYAAAPWLEYPREIMMIHTYKQFQVVTRIDLERMLPDQGAGLRHLVWIGVRRI